MGARDIPNNKSVQLTSDIEQSSHLGKYYHLVETEFLQSLGQTAYHCKGHPYDMGHRLEGSGNKPFRTLSQLRKKMVEGMGVFLVVTK